MRDHANIKANYLQAYHRSDGPSPALNEYAGSLVRSHCVYLHALSHKYNKTTLKLSMSSV